MRFSANYNKTLTWTIVGTALILIIVSIYFSYLNTRQYYQPINPEQTTDDVNNEIDTEPKETSTNPPDQPQNKPTPPPSDPVPPPDENPPWLDGPSDNDPLPPGGGSGSGNEPWNQGPSN